MTPSVIKPASLVLYKNRPGRIIQVGPKKIEITTVEGQHLSVRPKDVVLLHPGPINSFAQLSTPEGDLETAWELLSGTRTTLPEIAELAYGEYSPASAWSVWQAVTDGLLFSGRPEEILAHTPQEVADQRAAREAKAAERLAWSQFVDRLGRGMFEPGDRQYLEEVAALALGQRERSHVLSALDRLETQENAHGLLLETGYWDYRVNPYPSRAGLSTASPELLMGSLPDEQRLDLTHLRSLAIDDAGSQDPDDAISLDGNRLWVHIADVAALVPAGSSADLSARSRGANLYLPEGTTTMLPGAATGLLGLGLQEISPALSFGLDLNPDGDVEEIQIIPSWVKVQRLTYEKAETRLDQEPFLTLHRLAMANEARRLADGAIKIDLPEVKIGIIDDRVIIRPLPQLRSRNLVREAMLITGAAVGRYAIDNNIVIPFTSQDQPADELEEANSPSEMFARRKKMRASQQSLNPGFHAGLGMDVYVQATSPLRRYLDLVVHQQLRAHILGEAVMDGQELMQRIGSVAAISASVRWAERRSNEHWTLVYLLQNKDWRGQGIIIEKRGRRDHVLIPELNLETSLYQKRDLPLDETVQLAVQEVNLSLQEAHFRQV